MALESNVDSGSTQVIPSSPLLADSNVDEKTTRAILTRPISPNDTIQSLTQSSSFYTNTPSSTFRPVDIFQVGIDKPSSRKDSTAEICSSQDCVTEVNDLNRRTTEVSLKIVGLSEITTNLWIGLFPVTTEIAIPEISLSQVSSSEDNTSQLGVTKIDTFKIDSTKVSIPSSITLQQLLSSHNPNLQNTTVPTWTEFLQSPTPFNLKIEVTDLPTGQLAEATITGYDTNNRPNSGTLTLDTDGNSLGWFIDTTPDDNTEFDQTLSSTAYRATTGAASGKYDLLTTILHELGHLNGIIRGNNAFDTHVQNINGIPTFINGGITAQLTPDGSHLYPYDLMNTSLKPGVRKLPSALGVGWVERSETQQHQHRLSTVR